MPNLYLSHFCSKLGFNNLILCGFDEFSCLKTKHELNSIPLLRQTKERLKLNETLAISKLIGSSGPEVVCVPRNPCCRKLLHRRHLSLLTLPLSHLTFTAEQEC